MVVFGVILFLGIRVVVRVVVVIRMVARMIQGVFVLGGICRGIEVRAR